MTLSLNAQLTLVGKTSRNSLSSQSDHHFTNRVTYYY